MPLDELQYSVVFFEGPGASDLRRLDAPPSLRALRCSSIRHLVCNRLPLTVMLAVIKPEQFVFFLCPLPCATFRDELLLLVFVIKIVWTRSRVMERSSGRTRRWIRFDWRCSLELSRDHRFTHCDHRFASCIRWLARRELFHLEGYCESFIVTLFTGQNVSVLSLRVFVH